jgi:hypothetical protein
MENYNGIGNKIIEGGIFERFPKLKPQGGENYWQGKHSKLLLVGESNYFPDELESKSVFKDAEKWYFGEGCLLIPEEKISDVGNWVSGNRFNNLFNSMKKVLEEEGITDYEADLLEEAIYYNYFLRPASEKNKKGESDLGFKKNCKPIDCEVSHSALCGIIEVIEPNIVIFVSKFAWEKFMKFYKKEEKHFKSLKKIDFVYHFSSPRTWKHKNGNGQQKFENLLRDNWVKKNPMNGIVFKKLQTIHNLLLSKFQEEIYKPSNCSIHEGNYLSCLYLQVKDKTFCCETGVIINNVDFWTCFYKTENSKEIPALVGKGYKFLPDDSYDKIVAEIEKQIRQIIDDLSKTT